MVTKTDIELENFFIFNSNLSKKEGDEVKKILYYYPISDNTDKQIKNVGLVEGIIQFTETFKPSDKVNALHTNKARQLYYSPEKHFWMVITLSLPTVIKVKDGLNNTREYLEDDLQDNVYEAFLHQAYTMYRLFHGRFNDCMQKSIAIFKSQLEIYYRDYFKSIKLEQADILNIFQGIQYLPLDKQTFLKVQCFINALECKYDQIEHTAFLYNDHLIWSGVEPADMQIIYQYLTRTLLPENMQAELQGGSIPRNATSPFAALRHGRFIIGPSNLKLAKTVGKIPKLYLYSNNNEERVYQLVVYRALSASVCFFIKADAELTLECFKDLDETISSKLTGIVSDIAEYCATQVVTPSSLPDNAMRFIYFNNYNLAYKSTVHLHNKVPGSVACSKESLKIMADMKNKLDTLGHSGETIVKTMNDYWVIGKTSNEREFYIAIQQKNANLIKISEEVRKLCESELKGIFFHPI